MVFTVLQAISEDLGSALDELVDAGLLASSNHEETFSIDNTADVLDLLLAPELKTLVKNRRSH